jgi:hypothetical protein
MSLFSLIKNQLKRFKINYLCMKFGDLFLT